ncbi:hypothetical protein T484DRAFT_1881765, partial [Baffinella frigidus]
MGELRLSQLGSALEDGWKDNALLKQMQEEALCDELATIKSLASSELAGVYVLPSQQSVWDWHGMLCVNEGLFRHACFKFMIRIPGTYPEQAPKVWFVGSVPVHPLVHPQSGLVSLAPALYHASENPSGEWDTRTHR